MPDPDAVNLDDLYASLLTKRHKATAKRSRGAAKKVSTKMWKIEDWAGNILGFDGCFHSPPALITPMTFSTFENGWDWIRQNIPDEDNAHDDVSVEEIENEEE